MDMRCDMIMIRMIKGQVEVSHLSFKLNKTSNRTFEIEKPAASGKNN